MLDRPAARTYARGAPSSHEGRDGGEPASHPSAGRRRQLPSPAEQKRRQAWGVKWGQIMREAAREKGLGGKR